MNKKENSKGGFRKLIGTKRESDETNDRKTRKLKENERDEGGSKSKFEKMN